jgi:glycosyltransferase involved in cell wall biosynthesis
MNIMIIGGDDVNARIDLIKRINKKYNICCVGSSESIRRYFDNNDIKYFKYDLPNKNNILDYIRGFFQLLIIIKKVKPGLVLTFDTIPNIIGRLAAKCCSIKVVIGTQPGLGIIRRKESGILFNVVKKIAVFATKIINILSDMTIYQNSDDLDLMVKSNLISRSKSKLILSSGVDTEYFNGNVENIDSNKKNKRSVDIIMISRILKSKGIYQYWKLAKYIKKEFDFVNFHHVGDIVLNHFDSLKNEDIKQYKNHIKFHGQVENVKDLLIKSDIMVLPTTYAEGVPRVLLEAASIGLPLVAYDVPGCREVIIHDENGFLVDPGNDEELINSVTRLISDKDLRRIFSSKSIEISRKKFDISLIANQYLKIFDNFFQK